jgi:hypothetical protein
MAVLDAPGMAYGQAENLACMLSGQVTFDDKALL